MAVATQIDPIPLPDAPTSAETADAAFDPITFGVIRNRFEAIGRTLALVIWMGALSVGLSLSAAAVGEADEVQVKISATTPLKANQSIADDYYANRFAEPFLVQRLTDRTYFIAVDTYSATAYVGDEGVLVIDPLADGRAAKLMAAVASITDLPITAMIYSHSHLDHINDAQTIADAAEEAGLDLRVIATDKTVRDIERYNKPVPAVTEVVATPEGRVQFEGLTIDVITPQDHGHSEDSSIYALTSEQTVHYADVIEPGDLPYLYYNMGKDMKAVEDAMRQVLAMEWVFLNGGHGEVGKKHDVEMQLAYIADMRSAMFAALETFDMRDHIDPAKHPIAAIVGATQALAEAIEKDMAPKYGQYGEFEYVLEGQVYRMVSDLFLHGTGHLPPPE